MHCQVEEIAFINKVSAEILMSDEGSDRGAQIQQRLSDAAARREQQHERQVQVHKYTRK